MNETRTQTSVSSSARDPIDRWLDVFVRLLRVPKADAKRIRDELEDHLRARVDDLMLTGHAEPEAVRVAVAELGETAELARQFQTASRPHRRLTMLAGSAIVSAGLITGAMLLAPLNAPPQQQAIAVTELADAAATSPPVFAADLPVDPMTGYTTLAEVVAGLESLLDARVIAHYGPIVANVGGIGAETEIDAPAVKGLTLGQGLEQLSAPLGLAGVDPLVVQKTGEAYELATQSFFDRRDAVLIEYDVSELLAPPQGESIDPLAFQRTVQSLIEPDLWGERARLGMVSTTMIVNAHPRIHVQIKDLFARIEARYAEQREAHRQERRAQLESRLVQHTEEFDGYNRRIAEIEAELEQAQQERRAARERVYRLEFEAHRADDDQIIGIRLSLAEAQDRLKAAEGRMIDQGTRLGNMEQSLAITKGQIRAVETNLAALTDPAG